MVMTIGEVQPQEATIQVQEVANQVQAVTTQAHEATIQVPELPASSENNTSPSTIVAFEMSILVSGNNIPVFQVGDTTPLASSDTPPQLPLLLRCPRCQLLTTELVSPSKWASKLFCYDNLIIGLTTSSFFFPYISRANSSRVHQSLVWSNSLELVDYFRANSPIENVGGDNDDINAYEVDYFQSDTSKYNYLCPEDLEQAGDESIIPSSTNMTGIPLILVLFW